MSQSADVFGYLRIGASVNEQQLVQECLEFNRRVIAEAKDTDFWTWREFRFIDDPGDVRASQMISIAKIYTRLTIDEFQSSMLEFFKKLAWSDAYLVNRSIDRPLVGEPIVYEFDMENMSFADNPVRGVGESITIRKTVRAE